MSSALQISSTAITSSQVQGLKRIREESQDENPRLKKVQRMDELPPEEWSQLLSVADVVHTIVKYLPFQAVLNFEGASKVHREYTALRWKKLRVEDRLDFDWEACNEEIYPDKYRYLLGMATHRYIEERVKVQGKGGSSEETTEKLQRIYQRFERMMLKFPCFGAFVWNDLCRVAEKGLQSRYQELFSQVRTVSSEKAGELLLQGLTQLGERITQEDPEEDPWFPEAVFISISQIFTKVIQQNAACASYLAVRGFFDRRFVDYFKELAILSIGKNNDYRGLDELLDHSPTDVDTFKISFPPLQARHAGYAVDDNQREQFLDQAMIGYGEHAPRYVLRDAAYAKMAVGKWQEADILMTKAIALFDTVIDHDEGETAADRLEAAAEIKMELMDWPAAHVLYTRANVTADNLASEALRKFLSKQWQKAHFLYTHTIAAYGTNVPPGVLEYADKVKMELEQMYLEIS